MISGLWVLAIFIMKRVWTNIDLLHTKFDGISTNIMEYMKAHYECQRDLPLKFVDRERFNEFYQEWHTYTNKRDGQWEELSRKWTEMWNAFNNHQHERENGRVVRRDK